MENYYSAYADTLNTMSVPSQLPSQPYSSRKRQTQSCDRCKSKKRRCDGDFPCSNCLKANAECTMLIEQKKRGPKRISDDQQGGGNCAPGYTRSNSVGDIGGVIDANANANTGGLEVPISGAYQSDATSPSAMSTGTPATNQQLRHPTKRTRQSLPLSLPPGAMAHREPSTSSEDQDSQLSFNQSHLQPLTRPIQDYVLSPITDSMHSTPHMHPISQGQLAIDMSNLSVPMASMPPQPDARSPALSFGESIPSIIVLGTKEYQGYQLSTADQPAIPSFIDQPLQQLQQSQLLNGSTPSLQQIPAQVQMQQLQQSQQIQQQQLRQNSISHSENMHSSLFEITEQNNGGLGQTMPPDITSLQSPITTDMFAGNYIKPSAFNPQGYIANTFNDANSIQIDPKVLSLYAQLNPKMTLDFESLLLQQPRKDDTVPSVDFPLMADSFLYGPANLTLTELPGIPANFFLHLISMFFTYYHPTFPIIQETLFFETLIPVNKHHQMLLNTIYAIGCHFSRNSLLYQAPFYTPQRAWEFFLDRAYAFIPSPESKQFISSESLSICQASLLLASCDFSLKRSRTWMIVGIGCRMAQKYELYHTESKPDFFSLFNGHRKIQVSSSLQERKRVWWGALLTDMFVSISTGQPLLLSEAEYVDTMIDTSTLLDRSPPKLSYGDNPGEENTQKTSVDPEKWKPFFSGFPKDTIFGASDFTSDRWSKQSLGFFQVNHLFSNLDESVHIIRLSYIVRRIIRALHAPEFPPLDQATPAAAGIQSICSHSEDITRLHESLLVWYESLPLQLRLFYSLEAITTGDAQDLAKLFSIKEGERVSGLAVVLNLLLYTAFALLHQKNAEETAISFGDADDTGDSFQLKKTMPSATPSTPYKTRPTTFRMSTSQINRGKFESHQLLAFVYRAQCHLLKFVYGSDFPPPATTPPPSEMVCSPIVSLLMMPIAVALLGQKAYAFQLIVQSTSPNSPKAGDSAAFIQEVDPLPSVILPIFDNIAQVWSNATDYATVLRTLIGKVRQHNAAGHFMSDGTMQAKATSLPIIVSEPAVSADSVRAQTHHGILTASHAANATRLLGSQNQINLNSNGSMVYGTSHMNATPQYQAVQQLQNTQEPMAKLVYNQSNVDPVVAQLLHQNSGSYLSRNWHHQPALQSGLPHGFSGLTDGGVTHPLREGANNAPGGMLATTAGQFSTVQQGGVQRSWHELRSEFEDEFLL
ncbi:hypothetical protein BASA83_008652 [Batrachochytrium salamandrivorans]|nr:hypothetical protein BASA83_008652 [Batrachochytrium salamandrivorans]